MRIGGIGFADINGKLYIPNDVLTALSIYHGSILYGIYYPKDTTRTDNDFKHDFMITPIPYNFWSRAGRLIIRVKEQSIALQVISNILKEWNISILHCYTSRQGHRYSTIDFHITFEDLDPNQLTYSEEKGYYVETNEQLNAITDFIATNYRDILFIDENNIHLKAGIRNRINTGLHYFYYMSRKNAAKAPQDDQVIYKPFTLRYDEGAIYDDFGFIESNTGGKLSHIIARVENNRNTSLPSIFFISADTHYLNLRLVIIPQKSKHSFIKLDINYRRFSTPDSSLGLLAFFINRLAERYKIWKYYNQLYECRPGYGAGCLTFYLEDIYHTNFLNPTIKENLQDFIYVLNETLPPELSHIQVTGHVDPIYPNYIRNKFKLNELKSRTKKYDVFLSYSHKDQAMADELYQIFRKANLDCHMSRIVLKPGDVFDTELKKNLHNSRELCLLYSPNSMQSHWVATEWAIAWALDKKVVPVLLNLDHNAVKDEHKQRLTRRQWINFHSKEELEQYANDIYIRRLESYFKKS